MVYAGMTPGKTVLSQQEVLVYNPSEMSLVSYILIKG